MDLAEATRQYQATLTAIRSAEEAGTVEDFMYDELEASRRALDAVWLQHTIEGTA